MKRLWGHGLAGATLLSGAAAVFTACVHDDSSIYIQNVLAQQYAMSNVCMPYTADPAQPYTSSGVLDLALRQQYDATFLVGNQLVAQASSTQLRTETATVRVDAAIVRVVDAVSGRVLREFTRSTSGTVNPSSSGTPSFTPIGVTILDANTVGDLAGKVTGNGTVRVLTFTRFEGQTLGGQSVESDEFEFPIDVCNECLIAFTNTPSITINGQTQSLTTPNCYAAPSSGSSSSQPMVPCIIGEDLPVDCTACAAGFPACNPPALPDGGSD